jgi:hypothetical protein
MTDFKDQLDLAVKVVDKVAEVTNLHGENALQGGFGLDEKMVIEARALESKFLAEFPEPTKAPRENLVEFYKTFYRMTGMDENMAEISADLVLNTNVLSAIKTCTDK